MRRLVAHEAARLISEQGIDDYYLAKRKAAEKLGVSDQAGLPGNAEIEAAVVENQRLFDAQTHADRLRKYRLAARDALKFFSDFSPRVVGAVLSGAVAAGSDLEIHLFADTVELITLRLVENDVPYRLADRRLRTSGSGHVRYPAVRFVADDVPILALLFPRDGVRQAPRSRIDGRPMRRIDLRELELLLAE
ncbi:MAG: hypothetical protein OER80_13115 [Gammaproteobacteria bacterium]|nr:hypothetical protein [Gammaproteobacteria bacterium]